MRPLCSRTSCSKSKGGALAWLFNAARASAGRRSTRLQRQNDRSWPKCHFGPMARDLSLTGRDRQLTASAKTVRNGAASSV